MSDSFVTIPCSPGTIRAPLAREHVWAGRELLSRRHRNAALVEILEEPHSLGPRVLHVGEIVLVRVPEFDVNRLQLRVAKERSQLVQLRLLGVLDLVAELLASVVRRDELLRTQKRV